MNEKPDQRPPTVQDIDVFEDIPYLNGGLFRPSLGDDKFDEEDFDVRNSVLKSIIDLLERYSFSAGGSPTDLDPSVLGNVFEKTINYITSDNADNNKELGAYYTPSEITRFSAEETVRPALLDRFGRVLVEERDWPEAEVKNYDSVYSLIEDLPGNWGLISALLAEVDEFRVVDPACGSGHFLTSVLEEIVNVRKALYAQNENYPQEYRLKKTTVLNNIYGVDLMGSAVEIGKLRLWLSIISELDEDVVDDLDDDELALPNIVFNLREGNSLIGYTGFPETTDDGEYTLGSFTEDSVRDRYQDIITEIEKHEQAIGSVAEDHRQKAFEKLREAREDLIDDIHGNFVEAGIEDITAEEVAEMNPFNWVLEFAEVYADGGFDVLVGNPPWDVLTVSRDDFFSRYDKKFRSLTPNQKDERIDKLLENDTIGKAWGKYRTQMERQQDYFTDGSEFKLQSPTVAGQTNTNENDLSALFLERVFKITRSDGYVAQVLPGNIFNGSATKDLRAHLLDETEILSLMGFENHGIFDNIHNQYKFGIITFRNHGRTESLKGIFDQSNLDVLENHTEKTVEIPRRVLESYSPEARIFPSVTNQIEVNVLNNILKHPSVSEERGNSWKAEAHRELILAYDDDYLIESKSQTGDYPVYGGAHFYQFSYDNSIFGDIESPTFWSVNEHTPEQSAKHRVREKAFNKGDLKGSIFEKFGGEESNKSQKSFVNDLLIEHRDEPLSESDIRLDCEEYRIVFRDVTNSTNERTTIASVIPPDIVCLDSVRTVKPFKINVKQENLNDVPLHSAYEREFTDKELFVFVGLLNSIPFDFLLRTKVNTHIPKYKFEESQAPRLTTGDEWFEYIWTRAARLNCYGDEFEEMRDRLGGIEPATDMDERREVQAELDAAAFHAYGLDRDQTEFVLEDFHRVQNPRIMDEDYFESVLEKYDELAESAS